MSLYRIPVLLFMIVIGASCSPEPETIQTIVDRSIAAHGGEIMDRSQIEFDFRDQQFTLERNEGLFSYARTYTDSTGLNIREAITNDGYFRWENGDSVRVDSLINVRIGDQVNSVAYFTLLPIPLNDPAVIKSDLGSVLIDGEPYHRVGVSFEPATGGKDFQDEFVVWIHGEQYTMDYFAYYYFSGDAGSRFRSADGTHDVGGILLNDYLNWTHDDITAGTLVRYDSLYQADALRLVSEVRLDNVRVTPLSN